MRDVVGNCCTGAVTASHMTEYRLISDTRTFGPTSFYFYCGHVPLIALRFASRCMIYNTAHACVLTLSVIESTTLTVHLSLGEVFAFLFSLGNTHIHH